MKTDDSNEETITATPRMPPDDLRNDYVNAACRRDKQQTAVANARRVLANARRVLANEEGRLTMLETAEAEAYAAMVNAGASS
jgi:hypothetical protein